MQPWVAEDTSDGGKNEQKKKEQNVHTRSGWLGEAWPSHIRLTTLAANHCAAFARAHNGKRDKKKTFRAVQCRLFSLLTCGSKMKPKFA